MTSIKKKFDDTVEYVKNTDSDSNFSNDLKLEMYALYKQATQGDISGKKPGMMDIVGKAKYNAWGKIKGTSKEQAMRSYIDKVEQFKD